MPPVDPDVKREALKTYFDKLRDLHGVFSERLNSPCASSDIAEYELLGFLGRGGFGDVYRVRKDGQDVAVKVQNKDKLYPTCIPYVVRERKFLCAMDSVFITKVLGKWRDADNIYMYMDLAIFGDVRRFMRRLKRIPEPRVLDWVSQIVCAFEYIHACGVVYRDLKPGNCLIYEGGRLKIGDFGLAALATPDLNGFYGTHHYCAPEMYAGGFYSEAIDWWALGVCMYEMLVGRRPFSDRKDTEEVVREKIKQPVGGLEEATFSAEAKDLIMKLLEKDHTKRIGVRKAGVDDVKEHPWFAKTDFYDVIFEDVQETDLELNPVQPRYVEENLFQGIEAEDDRDRADWGEY